MSGREVRFGASTIERWYYAARAAADPVAILRNRRRDNLGRFKSLTRAAIQILTAQYNEHPGWTLQLHFDNLRVTWPGATRRRRRIRRSVVSCRRRGCFAKRRAKRATAGALLARDRLDRLEVRSYEVDYVSALWHLDFHHGSRKVLTRAGRGSSRYCWASSTIARAWSAMLQWYLDETAESLVHGLCAGLHEARLAARLDDRQRRRHARRRDHQWSRPSGRRASDDACRIRPYQNAKQESFWGRIEGRLMAMLEGEPKLTLDLLNQASQAWVEQEYHRTVHSEIGMHPFGALSRRPQCPSGLPVSTATLRPPSGSRSMRTPAACRWHDQSGRNTLRDPRRLSPPAAMLTVRYARWDLTHVDLVDPRSGDGPLPDQGARQDRPTPMGSVGASRRSRRTALVPPSTGIAPLLRQLLADYAATGLPPAYLPSDDQEPSMNHRLLALYGLKWNPFSTELPIEALFVPPGSENFCWRIEHAQIREGGFAMIHGDPGTGKSVALRLLDDRLGRLPDVDRRRDPPSAEQPGGFLSRNGRPLRRALATAQPLGWLQGLARSAGSRIWKRPVAGRCCWSMKRRR